MVRQLYLYSIEAADFGVKKERQTAYVLYVLCLSVFVTAQYPHSYEQKSISNRLRRWDFCLQACVLLRSAQQVRRPTEQLPVFFLSILLSVSA